MKKIIFISFILIQVSFAQEKEDIIYKYDGEVIKGDIVSGGNIGDYYVQIKSDDGYINIYMYEVKEIKRKVPIQKDTSILAKEESSSPDKVLPVIKKPVQQKAVKKKQNINDANNAPITNVYKDGIERLNKKGEFFITPKAGIMLINPNNNRHIEIWNIGIGGTIGYRFPNNKNLGFEFFGWENVRNIYLTYESSIMKILINVGVGLTDVDVKTQHKVQKLSYYGRFPLEEEENIKYTESGFIRIGIGSKIFGKYVIRYEFSPLLTSQKGVLQSLSVSF
jgi:hypothetical protein